jgi:hypothetical protein
MSWIYRADQETPSFAVAWSDRDGNLIDFSSGSYTFELKLVHRTTGTIALTKTTGITGSAASPNIVAAWSSGELAITPGPYRAHITATIGGADRMFMPGAEPIITIVAAV